MHVDLTNVAGILRSAELVACLTGAGVSAESGVATFRDAETGQWTKFNPAQLATQAGFAADPGLVWRWYMDRLNAMSSVQPNAGHLALAALESLVPSFVLTTQNIDDLHERAGNTAVLHLHGSIGRFRCNGCGAPYSITAEDRNAGLPPTCPHCADMVRPDVVWFGEMLPADILAQAQRSARKCNVMLVVGTSGVVYPAAELPFIARENGATIVEVNPEETEITTIADHVLRGPSGEMLPLLLEQLRRVP